MTIPSSRSLIFEVKSTGSELAFGRLRTFSENFGRLRKTSDFFGRLRTSSGMFGNDRVVFKNPSTPRIKISRLYLRKSWQVYNYAPRAMKHGSCIILLWSNLNWNRCIPYVAYVRVREYSLTKTYILLLKFPVKGKIFHRKKTYNVTSYASHQLAHLSSSPWRAWKLVQRKLVVGTFSYQGRHKEVSMATCKQ